MARIFSGWPVRPVLFLWAVLIPFSGVAADREWRDEGVYDEGPPAAYAGSAACRQCHKRQFEHWRKTVMARFVRDRQATATPLPGDWEVSPVADAAKRVKLVVGMRKAVAFVTDDWRVLPYRYHLRKKEWQARGNWARGGKDYRAHCGVCHLTGLNRDTRAFVEPGVGCEACHGPGALHAETEKASDVRRVPRRDGSADLDFCRRCHNQRKKHAAALKDFTGRFHPPPSHRGN